MNDEKNKHTTFTSHLTELRSRLVKSIIYLIFFFFNLVIFLQKIFIVF